MTTKASNQDMNTPPGGENPLDEPTSRFAFVRDHPVLTFFVITYLIGYIATLPLFITRIPGLVSLVPAMLMHGMVTVCGWYFNYNGAQAFGGATMVIAFTAFLVVAAVLACVLSPVFRARGAARSSSRLTPPVVGEAAAQVTPQR